ncbi:MAG: hypothetical protein ACE5E5_12815 [Phycisphaerae bacterium]
MKSIYVALLLTLATHLAAVGQVPQGFEIVQITSSPKTLRSTRINRCGQIVYHEGSSWQDETEIFLYDNGVLRQITDNNYSDSLPDINDSGDISWTRFLNSEATHPGEIVLLRDGALLVLGPGHDASINNLAHVAWSTASVSSITCPEVDQDVYMYDGTTVQKISDSVLADRSVENNDADTLIWGRRDPPCGGGPADWTAEIILYTETETVVPSSEAQNQLPHANNQDVLVWEALQAIERLENTEVTQITAVGANPRINNHGEIYFIRFHDEIGAWQPYLYRPEPEPTIYRLIEEPLWNTDGDINDYGECVWGWSFLPDSFAGGIRYMRRMRTGDTDFDDQIGASDFTDMPGCLTGPIDTDRLCDCRFYDMDHDRDVDLRDVAAFQVRFGLADAHLDYCHAHGQPGTNDPAVAACVCEALPFCCTTTTGWSQFCVDAVEALGCGRCGE